MKKKQLISALEDSQRKIMHLAIRNSLLMVALYEKEEDNRWLNHLMDKAANILERKKTRKAKPENSINKREWLDEVIADEQA
jgi:hypothetical protein